MSFERVAHPSGGARFLPAGAVTGIGSLPFAVPDEAVDFVVAHTPTVPFAPQPPADEGLEQLVREQLRLVTHRDGRHRQWFDAFHATVMAGGFPKARAVKVQVTGPLTLAKLCTRNGRPADQEAEALALLLRGVTDLAIWQLRRLRPAGLPILVVFDEPLLGALDAHDRTCAVRYLDDAMVAIGASGGIAGLHCCAHLGPGGLEGSTADLLSFDAAVPGALTDADVDVIGEPGRLVAFGLASTSPGARGPEQALTTWLQCAIDAGDAADLARRTLVTPTCGLGSATIADAEQAFAHAALAATAIERIAWEGPQPPVDIAATMRGRSR